MLFRRDSRKGFAEEPLLSVYREYGVIPKNSRDDNNNRPSEDLSTYQLVEPGDLVVNKMKAWQGSMAISRVRGIVSPAYFIYRPTHMGDDRYLHYLLRSQPMIGSYIAGSKGIRTNQWDLEPQVFTQTKVPTPPLVEQQAIADYLDRETQRIDELIAEQRGLIETLRERRQALVERGTGRGLETGLPMKDSKLEWIAEVPAHWKVANIRRFATMKTGHTPSRGNSDYWVDCTIPWVTLADVWQMRSGTQMYVSETESKISEIGLAHSAAELLPARTVMLSRTASVGFVGIMARDMATSQDYWNWICGPALYPEYLAWVLRSMRQELNANMAGSTHKTIYQTTAASFRIPVPPLDEQREIAAYLNDKTSRIDALMSESEDLIALSQERRAALITAAVTGQIDVRTAA